MSRALAVALAALLAARAAGAEGAEPEHATLEVHGRVVLDRNSSRMGLPAVTFDHWRHRALYTCRVCHVDLEFALEARETDISQASNEDGAHCGACHDGKKLHDGAPIFAACSGWPRADAARGCTRCHAGADHGLGRGYEAFKRAMPLDAAGLVDWAAAMRMRLVAPLDAVEGVSEKRAPMRIDRDVEISAVGTWLRNVTFSHRKHVLWSGCELCHPEVFPVTKRGSVRYGMADVRAGKFCGTCHLNVAFPIDECQRCHADEGRRWSR